MGPHHKPVSNTNELRKPTDAIQTCIKKRNTKPKKKKRRKKSKQLYKNFKIYYVNIRGIKSKLESLKQIINEQNPTVIAITETNLKENDDVESELKSYKILVLHLLLCLFGRF